MTTASTNEFPRDPLQAEAVEYLARHWPGAASHSRNHAYMALAGGLLHAGLTVERAEAILEALARATADEETAKRVEVVRPTAEKIRQKKPATGFPKLAELLGPDGATMVREFKHQMGLTITLADLAGHKKLPVDFLEAEGLHDLPLGGVGIPYKDITGKTLCVKERTALSAGSGSYWPRGKSLLAYGEHRLEDAERAGYLVLVEGETDVLTLWYHREPALGLPGADTVGKSLALGHVAGRRLIYVVREPGGSGNAFVPNVVARLTALGWSGTLKEVRLGVKDASELHLQNPERFLERWRVALEKAEVVPLPQSGGAEPPPWHDPLPLSEVPGVPPFPVVVLPELLRRFVLETALALPCPPDYVAVPLLVMGGGAIGASRVLAVKPGHVQRAAVYAGVVGPPGSAKTPAQELVVEPAHDAEEQLHVAWEQKMERYRADLDAYEADLKEWKKAKAGERGEPPTKSDKPILTRLTVNDATAESLVPILQENPRGVVLVRDELIGWIQAMNQYREGGKGADQQFWLSAWSGSPVTVDRKKTHDLGPLRVRHPFISVIGGLTPDKLPAVRGDRPRQRVEQDGFIDRLLFAYPPESPAVEENWLEVADETKEWLRKVFERLRSLAMVPVQEGGVIKGWRPFVVKLTADGRQAWQRFTRAHALERNAEDFPPHLAGPWSKLRGYAARLALIVHCLRWAAGEDVGEDVDGESMERAAKLVAYFKAHARKVYAVIDADRRVADARKILRWVRANRLEHFQKRDAYQALKGTFKTVEDLEPLLNLLERHGYIRLEVTQDRPGPGRKPSPHYEVNPQTHSQNSHNPHNGHDPDDDFGDQGSDDHDGPDSGDCGNSGNDLDEDLQRKDGVSGTWQGLGQADLTESDSGDSGNCGNEVQEEKSDHGSVFTPRTWGRTATPSTVAGVPRQFPLSPESPSPEEHGDREEVEL
jgi:hypothetical protein